MHNACGWCCHILNFIMNLDIYLPFCKEFLYIVITCIIQRYSLWSTLAILQKKNLFLWNFCHFRLVKWLYLLLHWEFVNKFHGVTTKVRNFLTIVFIHFDAFFSVVTYLDFLCWNIRLMIRYFANICHWFPFSA